MRPAHDFFKVKVERVRKHKYC